MIHVQDGGEESAISIAKSITWKEFTKLLNLSVDDTVFWSSPTDWEKFQRNNRGRAMCTEDDLKQMFTIMNKDHLEWVQVYDAKGQFDEP